MSSTLDVGLEVSYSQEIPDDVTEDQLMSEETFREAILDELGVSRDDMELHDCVVEVDYPDFLQ